MWVVRGRALTQPRPLVPSGLRQGPTTHWLWVRGLRAWGPVTNPTAPALASWLCSLWGRHGGARGGGRVLPGCGASGEPPSRDLSSFRGAAGARFPLAWVRCAGVGAWLSLAPSPVPRFVVCWARFRGSRHPVAAVAWHLSSCRGCGRRRASLACLVPPRWCAAPRPVRSLSVLRSAFPSPWCLPPALGLSPRALLAGWAGHVEAGREPGSLCLPLAPAGARALGALRVVPVRGPAMGLSLAGPSGFGLGLRALRLFACVDPVTDASGFPYRPSFDGGLGQCTGAVSCGRRHLPFRVGGRHARVPCVCVCVLLLVRSGGPASRVRFGAPHLLLWPPFERSWLLRPPPGWGCPVCGCFRVFVFPSFFFLVAPRLSLLFRVFRPRVPWAFAFGGPPPPFFFFLFTFSLSAPPPPPGLFFCFFVFFCPSCFSFVCSFFFVFCFFAFLRWCAGSAVFGLVCVSCAVGCAGVCFCGPCAPAGAVLRLRCVVGCSLVLPILCVLLPVLGRCRGVFCVLPRAVWRACVGLGSFPLLLPPVAVSWSPVVARGCVLSWGAVLRCPGGRLSCGVVLSPSCLAGGPLLFLSRRLVLCVVACGCRLFVAGSCCLLLFPLACVVAVAPAWPRGLPSAVCSGLLWCPAPLWCVLCSVVLCCPVVPCCAALLSVFLCWWCWCVSFPCVCGAVLHCASCCSVPVRSALLLVPRAVVCCCVLWCLPCRSVAWRCCSGVS